MARASWYEYTPDPFCLFCGERTEETVRIRHDVGDLPTDKVAICAHRGCYRRKVRGLFLFPGAILVLTPALLGLLETLAFYAAYHRWTPLPPLLLVANVLAGLLVGIGVGIQEARQHRRQLNDHVQLRTYPCC